MTRGKVTTRFIAIFTALATVVLLGAGCGSETLPPPTPVEITVWRSEENTDALETIAQTYSATYAHVNFNFRTLRADEYEEALFEAWSKGDGPDIFSVPNTRFGKFKEFASPMPQTAALRRAYVEKSFGKKQTIVEERSVVFPSPSQIRDQFANVVAQDVVFDNQVYGLPYSMDTMVMYYNRDILAQAQVAVPPTTWAEFVNAAQAIVELDDEQNIVLPAAALGTADNVDHYFDILSLLMMQNGADMINQSGTSAAFGRENEAGGVPGIEALNFYTSFSDLALQTYTWNDEQLSSLEAFTQGNLAFYFGYYEDLATIERRAPGLNFSYTKMPQVNPSSPVNYAQYPVESVHIGSENPEHAWNFIRVASAQDNVGSYLESVGRLPALKSLIGESQEDPELGTFIQQALTAKSWYHGHDPDEALAIFKEMIDSTREKVLEIEEIVRIAVSKTTLTIQED